MEENNREDEKRDEDRLEDQAETARIEERGLPGTTLARSCESTSFARCLRSPILSTEYRIQQLDVLVSHILLSLWTFRR